MLLQIKGARVIDPSQKLDRVADLFIEDGKILKIGGQTEQKPDRVIEASGLVAAPGLVDMHVHLRDPGFLYKEDIFSGCEAAAAGGVTSVACMPNTKPVADNPMIIGYMLDKAKKAKARVYPIGAVTIGQRGEALSDFQALKAAGAVGVSDDGLPVKSAKMLQEAMKLADENGLLTISHCEDLEIINGGKINKGEVSERLGVPGMDRTSEDSITAREIAISAATGNRIHIAHVSTKGSAALVRDAKARGVRVTAETAPHYFMLTDELLAAKDADYRMNPPLRTREDVEAIRQAVIDGVFDAIITDHAPHSPEEKSDFMAAPNGIVGLETSLAASITALVKPGYLSLMRLLELMSTSPAKVLGIEAGSLREGAAADVVLFDPREQWVVDPQQFYSRARNSSFKGMTLTGRVHYTLLGGEIVYAWKKE